MASFITAGNATNGLQVSSDNTGILELRTGTGSGTTAVTVNASQNVGVGTGSISGKLDVLQNQNTAGGILQKGASSSTSLSSDFYSVGLQNTNTTANNYNTLAFVNDEGSYSAGIHGVYTSHTAGAQSGALAFTTRNAGTFAERARITSGGNFGVGTTTPGTSYGELVNFTSGTASQPSLTLLNTNASFSNDVFQLRCANTAANGNSWNMITGFSSTSTLNFLVRGSGNVQNTNNSYGAISDERLKENIVDATPKLEKLNQVRIVNFNLKGEEHKQIGVVAQELEQVFPGMIEENQDGMKGVKYSVFVPMLIKAMQEQQQMIETLQAKVAALEGA